MWSAPLLYSKAFDNLVNKYQKVGNDNDFNNMNGSVLNMSVNNNSMMQLLNKSNINNKKDGMSKLKNKKKNKISIINRSKKKIKNVDNKNINVNPQEDEKIFKENEDTLDLLKSNNRMIPHSIKVSLYVSLFFSFLFLLSISINYIDIHKKRNIWEYAINLSMNYLEKIPKLVELTLSTYLVVILGDLNRMTYHKKDIYEKYQRTYMSYFKKLKNYDNSELLSSNIKDSFFANELFDNYRIKKNLEYCENDGFFKSYFYQTKYWNKKLNENNKYCINAALGGVLFYNKWISNISNYIQYVDIIAFNCVDENSKLDISGLDLEIDLILYELTFLYLDFEEKINTNITEARNNFFKNENLKRILRDMNLPFTFASGTLYSATNEDMNNLNNYISKMELFFIIITYIIDGTFICLLILMIISNEKNKSILIFIAKTIKKT